MKPAIMSYCLPRLDEIYDERSAYNHNLDIVIDLAKLSMMNRAYPLDTHTHYI